MKIPFQFLLEDKGGYVSRKLGLVYWILHITTFLFLLGPIGSITQLFTLTPLLTAESYVTIVLGIAGLYLGANVIDKNKPTSPTLTKDETTDGTDNS